MSLTRSRKHSIRRSPLPYSNAATNRLVPDSCANTSRTSARVNTTGNFLGRLARTMPPTHPGGAPNTSR